MSKRNGDDDMDDDELPKLPSDSSLTPEWDAVATVLAIALSIAETDDLRTIAALHQKLKKACQEYREKFLQQP